MTARSPGGDDRTIPDALRRRREVALAGHHGRPTAARHALGDPDAAVRATALGALARCACLPASTLVAAAADPDAAVRRRVAELLAQWGAGPLGDADAPLPLLPLLGDDDATVVEVAAFAAGELLEAADPDEPRSVPAMDAQPPEVVGRLAGLTVRHEDALVREAAVAALGSIGDPDGLAAVLVATTDKPAVRRRAVLALAPFAGPEVDEALARAADDRDWQVRQAAEDLTDT